MQKKPHRLGIILVGNELNSAALKLLILSMNRVQAHFEYDIFPQENDDDQLLKALASRKSLDREAVRELAQGFPDRFKARLAESMRDYRIVDVRPPDYLVVVSMAQFGDEYFNMRCPGVTVIALKNWKRSMAPPSLIEFIQTLIVREAVGSVCPALRASIHYGSKGCICDFSPALEDVRLKVLNGFVCSYCTQALQAGGFTALPDEIKKVLGKEWLGNIEEPQSIAGMLANLGVNLFVTKGLAPTWPESIRKTLQEDEVKEILRATSAIVVAGAIFYLGLKASH